MKQLIRKWADLGVQSKLSAIALLALLGMLVPICLYTAQLRAATQVDRSELMGLPPLQALLDAIAELHAYRATGATDLAARERAGAAIGAVLPRIEGLAQFERSRPALEEFARTWDRLAAATGDQARAAASDAAAEAALGALDAMRDESALVYTPYVHSYHLVIANLVEGPESREALTRLMVELQAGAAPDGSAAPAASAVTRLEAFQRSHLGYRRELEKSIALLDDEATQQLKQAADEEAATYAAASEVLARAARGGAAAGVRASVAAAGADIARSMERLGRVSLETLTSQSKQHLSNDTYAMWRAIGLLTLLAIGIGVLTWHTTRVLVRDIRQAARVAAGIAAGRLDNAIEVASRDEVGQLLGDMQRMQSQVQSVIGAQNEMARRHDEGQISFRMDADSFPGDYGRMVHGTNQLVASHLQAMGDALRVIEHYSVGDLTVDMERLPGEKASLTEAMDATKANLASINAEIKRLAAAATAGDFSARGDESKYRHDFREMVAGMNRLMQTTDRNLGETSTLLKTIAHGDLTARMDGDFHGVFARIRDDANATARQLTDIVGQIKRASVSINTSAGEIASGNADLSQRTEQQAANLEETAASMEELTSTVRQNAESARQANQLAIGAASVASQGGEVVGQVVTTMRDIEQSSKKIAEIISVIDGIAFQTNILALNAAVEAARAGEQGRGFAVVASEVRTLAQRSAAAAKEIKGLIETSVDKVSDGSALVSKAGATMGEIVASVQRVTDIMAEISAASQEQSAGIEQVNQTITQMDETTQQNAALVEEASAAARSMEEQAQALAQTVAVFVLDKRPQAMARASAPVAGAKAGAAARAPRRTANAPARVEAVMEAEWQEF